MRVPSAIRITPGKEKADISVGARKTKENEEYLDDYLAHFQKGLSKILAETGQYPKSYFVQFGNHPEPSEYRLSGQPENALMFSYKLVGKIEQQVDEEVIKDVVTNAPTLTVQASEPPSKLTFNQLVDQLSENFIDIPLEKLQLLQSNLTNIILLKRAEAVRARYEAARKAGRGQSYTPLAQQVELLECLLLSKSPNTKTIETLIDLIDQLLP